MLYLLSLTSLLQGEKTDKVWYAPYKKQAYGNDEIKAVLQTLADGWLAPGPRTEKFEKQVSKYFGKKYGLFVNSGSSANLLAVICSGLQPGDEVITPACTFSTTVAPLVQVGASVKFCDVEPHKYVPSIEQILNELTDKTKVIMIPNLLGNKIDWHKLREELKSLHREDILLIEDSCDTMTHTEDSDISTVSFYASHIITAGGTGGMVMFNNESLYKRALSIRDWGRAGNNEEAVADRFNHNLLDGIQYDWKFLYTEFGYNFKACEMNAAFGLVQMQRLPDLIKTRKHLYEKYISTLKNDTYASRYFKFPVLNSEDIVLLALPLECPDRMDIIKYLEENNIQTRVTMAGNILRHPIYTKQFPEQAKRSFPVADQVMREGFLIGCHHGLNDADVERVCNVLIKFARNHLLDMEI